MLKLHRILQIGIGISGLLGIACSGGAPLSEEDAASFESVDSVEQELARWEWITDGAYQLAVGGSHVWSITPDQRAVRKLEYSERDGWKWLPAGALPMPATNRATRIAAMPDGTVFVVSTAGTIFVHNQAPAGPWATMPGCATDIAVAPISGAIWSTSCKEVFGGGFRVMKLVNGDWAPTAGGGMQLAVGFNGVPWVTTFSGTIHYKNSANADLGGWTQLSGFARGLAVGDPAFPWVIANDWKLSQYEGGWHTMSSFAALDVDMQTDGRVWSVDSVGGVRRQRW